MRLPTPLQGPDGHSQAGIPTRRCPPSKHLSKLERTIRPTETFTGGYRTLQSDRRPTRLWMGLRGWYWTFTSSLPVSGDIKTERRVPDHIRQRDLVPWCHHVRLGDRPLSIRKRARNLRSQSRVAKRDTLEPRIHEHDILDAAERLGCATHFTNDNWGSLVSVNALNFHN